MQRGGGGARITALLVRARMVKAAKPPNVNVLKVKKVKKAAASDPKDKKVKPPNSAIKKVEEVTASKPKVQEVKPPNVAIKKVKEVAANGRKWSYRPLDRERRPASFYKPMVTPDPQWALALAQLVPDFRKHVGGSTVLSMWSDCAGMGSEIFAMKMLAEKLKILYNVDIDIKVVGVCEKKQDCCVFLEENHKPEIISKDICNREIRAGDGTLRAYDLNVKTGSYEEIPHNVDIYALGIPSTAWARHAR